MTLNVAETYRQLRRRLTSLTGHEGEATEMARLIFYALKGWSTTDLVIHSSDHVSEYILDEIEKIMKRLKMNEPLQYILGHTRFYGLNLDVSRDTLIPRPETEELVEIILNDTKGERDLRVLDVGTGSGAIAIALSRNMEFPEITALDVSEKALKVACSNAARLHARINFLNVDIFDYEPPSDSFDLIVSNPPYIAEHEREGMDSAVKDYEPSGALFVPDKDPLIFYRRICCIGRRALSDRGRIFFEINPLFADQLKQLMKDSGYEDVEIIEDMSAHARFARGVSSSR